jgi:hypothetical protein
MNFYEMIQKELNGKHFKKAGYCTYFVDTEDINSVPVVGIQYHATVILSFYPDGTFQFTNGGWQTKTTKDRLNLFSREWNLGFGIHQSKKVWYLTLESGVLECPDSAVFASPGVLNEELGYRYVVPNQEVTAKNRRTSNWS